MADLYEVMRNTPSTRAFTDAPVDPAVLRRVFENARFAPNGGNRQGWRVIVVTDPRTKLAMRDLYLPNWEAYTAGNGAAAALAAGEASGLSAGRLRMLRAADDYAREFDRVPVHLVICVELAALAIVDGDLGRTSISGGASVYPFAHNILLALRAENLGGSFTTLLAPSEPALRELLAIPDGVAFAGDIGVGHRADPWPAKLTRAPVEDFTFGERYNEPWPDSSASR
jgi:nitroreductase